MTDSKNPDKFDQLFSDILLRHHREEVIETNFQIKPFYFFGNAHPLYIKTVMSSLDRRQLFINSEDQEFREFLSDLKSYFSTDHYIGLRLRSKFNGTVINGQKILNNDLLLSNTIIENNMLGKQDSLIYSNMKKIDSLLIKNSFPLEIELTRNEGEDRTSVPYLSFLLTRNYFRLLTKSGLFKEKKISEYSAMIREIFIKNSQIKTIGNEVFIPKEIPTNNNIQFRLIDNYKHFYIPFTTSQENIEMIMEI